MSVGLVMIYTGDDNDTYNLFQKIVIQQNNLEYWVCLYSKGSEEEVILFSRGVHAVKVILSRWTNCEAIVMNLGWGMPKRIPEKKTQKEFW